MLAAARVIKVAAGKRRAPVLRHADRSLFLDMGSEFFLCKKRDAYAIEGRLHDVRRCIKDRLALDTRIHLPATALKFPDVYAARRETDIDAIVPGQSSGAFGAGCLAK